MEGAAPVLLFALWTVVSQGRTEEARRLLVGGADVEEKGGLSESTPLHEAARVGNKEIVQLLLEHGADVSFKNKDGETPLHAATLELELSDEHLEYLEVVRLLLQRLSDPSSKDNDGTTPLHWVAWSGAKEFVCLLLERGADVSAKNKNGETPLHFTAQMQEDAWNGHEEVALLLLKDGADIFDKDNDGETALHFSTVYGHSEMVRFLLEHGADISARNKDGKTPLDVSASILDLGEVSPASASGHEKVAALLRAEVRRRATWTAVAMGQHARLGAGSIITTLPPELVKMVLDQV